MENKIILASGSPRRKEIFEKLGIAFEIIPSDFDESSVKIDDPVELIKKLSYHKAKSVFDGENITIGVDTMGILDGETLGKPKDKQDAVGMLKKLSGRVHDVVTGVTIMSKGKILTDTETTKVKFKEMTDEEVKAYVETGEPMGKAASYAIQLKGSVFIEWVKGDFFNVMGLPLYKLSNMLKEFGVEVTTFWV